MGWLIIDEHAIEPAATKQLHNSEKQAPCDEHVKFSCSSLEKYLSETV